MGSFAALKNQAVRYIFLLLLTLSAAAAFSQTDNLTATTDKINVAAAGAPADPTGGTGDIKGVIRTSDGNPAESVSIGIKGTSVVTVSDKDGKYEIKKVKPGAYTLVVSFAGLASKEVKIGVRSNETVTAPEVTLDENSKQLNEVVVSANRNKGGEYVAKMPLKYMENPQVYSSVSAEILKQQIVTSYDDALRNIPGISRTWESTGRPGDGGSYFALRGFEAQPSLINGLPGLTSGNLDPADVEEIQVIKGPSGTLFGASFYGYGGIINTITKKPYFDFGGEVTYNVGSFGMNRATADINAPLGKKVALRMNAAWQTENSFQDAGFRKSFFIAPSLVYKASDKLQFNVLIEVLEEKRAAAPIFFNSDRSSPLTFKNLQELNLNNKLSFTSNDLTIRNPRVNVQAQMQYKLSSQWTSQTVFSAGRVKSKGIYAYIWDDLSGDNYFDQYFHDEKNTTTTIDVQQNFNGDFKLGNMRNRLLVGLDLFTRNVKDNGSGWVLGRHVTPQSGEVEYTDPETDEHFAPVHLTGDYVKGLLAATDANNSNSRNNAYGAYVSDVINLTPALTAMVSVRVDYFDSKGEKSDPTDDFHQWAVSPKFGLVYQPILDKLSVFANYMNAFVNVAPQQTFDLNGDPMGVQSFKPEHANQWEAGMKASLIANKLNATLSYYDIKVGNRVYPDPANPNNSKQGGKVGSKGIELDLHANLVEGLSILAGVSHNRMKVLEGNKDDFYNEPGRNPGGQGPQDLANLWVTYQFRRGVLKNFGIGAGGNYAGIYKVIDNSVTGVFELPSYTLLNGGVFYNSNKFRVGFNVNNITDKAYYIGYWSVNPQKPRNFAASVAFKF
jgi:iron complex outermembrane receptor protein